MKKAVTKACTVHFGPNATPLSNYTVTLPAGLRVEEIRDGATRGNFWLDQFPLEIFPGDSLMRWDAIHYGVTLGRDQVEFVDP